MRFLRAFLVMLAIAAPVAAAAQQTVLQGGPTTPGHIPQYYGWGTSQPVIMDGGGAAGGSTGVNPSEQGLTVRNPAGVYPADGAGNGPLGTNWCDYDAPITNANGYHYLCIGFGSGGPVIAAGAGGVATPLPFNVTVNGSTYSFPGSFQSIVSGITAITSGANNGVLYDNAGVVQTAATGNNGVLVTSSSGVPSISSTLPSGLTLPSPTVSSPTVSGGSFSSPTVSGGSFSSPNISGATSGGGLFTIPALSKVFITGQLEDVRFYGAVCDGATDDTAAINTALVAATQASGGIVAIPSGYVCGFGTSAPIVLQHHTTLQIQPNATLKYLGTSGDEIVGTGDNSLDDRMNVAGPGAIDATHATGGNIIHFMGGTYDLVSNLAIQANSTSIVVLQINGNSLTGGVGNWRLNKVDGLNINGVVGDVIDLIGTIVSGPTNNSFYNINANDGNVVAGRCLYAPRDDDTEYFFNFNCANQNSGDGIVLGSATGQSFTVTSGTYNSASGVGTVTLSGGPSPAELQVGDTIQVALTGTNVSSLNRVSYACTGISSIGGNTTVTFAAQTGVGSVTITGGIEATVDTDAWGYHFNNYILSSGNFAVALLETHDDSFIGGDDFQAQANPGINVLAGPGHGGTLSPSPTYIACHTMGPENSGYLCASHTPYTVATLPTVGSGAVVDTNAEAYVTDATGCTGGGSMTGGGSTFCHVRYNGASWLGSP